MRLRSTGQKKLVPIIRADEVLRWYGGQSRAPYRPLMVIIWNNCPDYPAKFRQQNTFSPTVQKSQKLLTKQTITGPILGKTQQRFVFSQAVMEYKTCPDAIVLRSVRARSCEPGTQQIFLCHEQHAQPRGIARALRRAADRRRRQRSSFMWKLRKVGGLGPGRIVVRRFLPYGLVWFWNLLTQGGEPTMWQRPWYQARCSPWCVDALADLRTIP